MLSEAASEKGKEAEVTHALIEQVLEASGPNAISLRLSDALLVNDIRSGQALPAHLSTALQCEQHHHGLTENPLAFAAIHFLILSIPDEIPALNDEQNGLNRSERSQAAGLNSAGTKRLSGH